MGGAGGGGAGGNMNSMLPLMMMAQGVGDAGQQYASGGKAGSGLDMQKMTQMLTLLKQLQGGPQQTAGANPYANLGRTDIPPVG